MSRYVFDRAPARVYWEITRACDLACRHCRAEAAARKHPDELTTEQGFALLDQLAQFGAPLPHVVLTGGDPLKRPDLFALIRHARSRGLEVSVSPSGTPLLTEEAIRGLKDAGVDAISLSLDGATAASHDAIRRVPGCFDRTHEAAHAAVRAGLPFQVNTLVCLETLGELEAIHPVVRGMGAARWSLFFLVSVGRGTVLSPISAEQCESLFEWVSRIPRDRSFIVTTTEAPHYRRIALEKAKAHGGPEAAARLPGLGIRDGNGILFISHTGEACPSGFLPLVAGNVKKTSVIELYRDTPLFRSLREPDALEGRCGRCEYRFACGGSRARAFSATGSVLGEDPLCLYVPRADRAAE